MSEEYNLDRRDDAGVGDSEAEVSPPSNGTPTSDAAASYIEPVSGRLRRLVYDFIMERGGYGATAQEVEQGLGLVAQTVTPRVVELRKKGLVEVTEDTRKTRSGCRARVYVAVAWEVSRQEASSRSNSTCRTS